MHRSARRPLSLFCAAAVPLGLTAALAAQTPPGACTQESAAFATAEGGCKDLSSGLVWSAATSTTIPGVFHTWPDADTYCATLVEGGFDDWRLPTIDEHQESLANGIKDHVAWQPYDRPWSSKTQGTKAFYVDWGTGEAVRTLQASTFAHFCVRGESGNGGGGNGGGNGGGKGGGKPKASQKLGQDAWSFDVDAPAHAGRDYVVLVGLQPRPAGPGAAPDKRRMPVAISGEVRRFDGAGRAHFELDRRGLEAGQQPADTWVGLVVLDPKAPGGIAEVMTLARPSPAEKNPSGQ